MASYFSDCENKKAREFSNTLNEIVNTSGLVQLNNCVQKAINKLLSELAKKEETPLLVQEADISDNQSHELTAIETSPCESKRQVQDEAEINKRIEELPENLRKSLVEKFKVNFVSIEKIDQDQLI